jgi:hypothetical protein
MEKGQNKETTCERIEKWHRRISRGIAYRRERRNLIKGLKREH